MDIDVALDEVIAKKKSRGSSGRGRGRGAGKRTASGSDPRKQLAGSPASGRQNSNNAAAGSSKPLLSDSGKIVVSNLPNDVTEPMVRDLFTTTIGHVKYLSMAYDSKGKPTGTATLEFKDSRDGAKAFAKYNGRLIDGKRAMRIELVVDPSKAPPQPLSSRLAPAPAEVAPAAANGEAPAAGTGRSRGRRGRGRGGKGGRENRPAKTAEQLDAEMDSYNTADAPAAA